MTRRVLTDAIWSELLNVMLEKGCYEAKNSREIMEAILWKLRTGSPWRDLPAEFGPWQTPYGRFNRWSKSGLWEDFFLSYEVKLIRSGYSQTEVTLGLTSMRVELGLEKSELLGDLEADPQQNFILPPMRTEIRSILKSLGVKSTTPKLHVK